MGFKKGNKDGVKFGEGQPINKNGRPKKMVTKFKETGYTKTQVRDTYSAIAGLTDVELTKVINDKESTVLEKAVAKAFQSAMSNGDYKFIQSIVELFADKATQHNVTKLETVVKYENYDDAQLDEMIKKKMAFSES